jgi:glycerol-3-phosphate dehydrogenase
MGSAKWFDAVMLNPQRLLMEMLRWACSAGATALNYMEVTGLFENDGARWGLRATDRLTGHSCSFHGAHIVVAAGPWSGALEDRLGLTPEAPFHPSLAFNVLLDRKPVAPGALALSSSRPNGNTLFLHECNGRLFAGTAHRPLQGKINGEPPDETIVAGFLDELNAAIPSLECSPRDVLRLFWGYLPVAEPGTTRLESRSRIWSYGSHGGQRGIYSVQGVKFTTARSVAEKTLRTISKHNGEPMPPRIPAPKPESRQVPDLAQFKQLLKSEPDKLTSCIQAIIREESATCLSDIVLRRTDWGLHQSEKPRVEAALEELLGWQGDGEMRREDLVN